MTRPVHLLRNLVHACVDRFGLAHFLFISKRLLSFHRPCITLENTDLYDIKGERLTQKSEEDFRESHRV